MIKILKEPESMDECVYYTYRGIGQNGEARAWVYREKCPKCQKAMMGKPKDAKTGKVKIRATEYACPECGHTEKKEEYESKLTANVKYTCPHCASIGEASVPFLRRKAQIFDEDEQKKVTVELLRLACGKCGKNIDITKKMK